jgi:hypothetical protein
MEGIAVNRWLKYGLIVFLVVFTILAVAWGFIIRGILLSLTW